MMNQQTRVSELLWRQQASTSELPR